jgi:hypothetical protein
LLDKGGDNSVIFFVNQLKINQTRKKLRVISSPFLGSFQFLKSGKSSEQEHFLVVSNKW